MPHYMHVAPEEETAMRLGELPHNPRWALNLFACVAILGAKESPAMSRRDEEGQEEEEEGGFEFAGESTQHI